MNVGIVVIGHQLLGHVENMREFAGRIQKKKSLQEKVNKEIERQCRFHDFEDLLFPTPR